MENISVNIENLSPEKQEQFRALIAEANKSKRWKPQIEEGFFILDGNGGITATGTDDSRYVRDCIKFNNCFRTRAEAEFAREKALVLAELQMYADEHNEYEFDWCNGKQKKWYMGYNYSTVQYYCDYSYAVRPANVICFSSEQIAHDAIRTVGKERVAKYLFEIEPS